MATKHLGLCESDQYDKLKSYPTIPGANICDCLCADGNFHTPFLQTGSIKKNASGQINSYDCEFVLAGETKNFELTPFRTFLMYLDVPNTYTGSDWVTATLNGTKMHFMLNDWHFSETYTTMSTFGTKVTVVEFLKECLPVLDSDIAKRLRKVLEKRGVDVHLQCAVKAITQNNGRRVVTFADKKGREQAVEASQVLMAVGRAPRVFDHFHNAGFEYDVRRGITVDDHYQTTIPGIYAIGDVNGRQMLAHAAEMQAKMVVDHIVSPGTSEGGEKFPIPAAIFTSPEAACVGPSEYQLKADGQPYECRKAFYRANGKALAMNETEGMLKLFSESGAGRILGCHVYGAHAADLVQEASVLICKDTTVEQLRQMVHIHPTLSEVLLAAAEQ